MSVSSKLDQIFEQAHGIASASSTRFCSVHLLFSYFVVDSPARNILDDLGIQESELLKTLSSLGQEDTNIVDVVTQRAWQMTELKGRERLDTVVYLGCLVLSEETLAHELLERCEIDYRQIVTACEFSDAEVTAVFATTEHRETAAYGSVEATEEAVYATALSVPTGRGSRSREQSFDNDERRSHSPGRRRSDRLERGGKRRDRRQHKDCADPTFLLDPQRFPTLSKLATNLSAQAASGELEDVIGRQNEITEVIDILSKRKSNNPLLIGEAGVGKTALVEGVVTRLVDEYRVSPTGRPKIVLQLDVGSIMAGTHLRGALADRIRSLQAEVKDADGHIYLFIDELHSLFGNQSDGGADAANELKVSLARGDFPCIGATTIAEYREHIESDAALSRRFSTVLVEEPTPEETETIVYGALPRYESHHEVIYEKPAVTDAIRLGRRYLYEQRDPDRTLGILDWAGAIAKRSGASVGPTIIREVISRSARIPLEHLTLDASERFLTIETTLKERILGQPHVAKVIGDTLIRNLAGFSGGRPIGSLLFVGPTGVGKTEVVKTLATLLFGSSDALSRFDMSEFAESHTVSRLIGSPPGYVGHQEGGQLTESVLRRPYQVILLDEIEKAHRDIWNLLLQVTDEGHLSDSRGRRVDFSNTLLVMTSNLGAHLLKPNQRGVGFSANVDFDPERAEEKVLHFAKDALPLEFWNRLDARLVFRPLEKSTIIEIAEQLVERSRQQIYTEREINYEVSTAALAWVVDHGGFDWELGARPLRTAIAKWLETPISEAILKGELSEGQSMHIDVNSTGLTYEVVTVFDANTLKPEEMTPTI